LITLSADDFFQFCNFAVSQFCSFSVLQFFSFSILQFCFSTEIFRIFDLSSGLQLLLQFYFDFNILLFFYSFILELNFGLSFCFVSF